MSNAPQILVIDDEAQIQRAIKTILTEKGFRVTTASRGEEGLTLAAANEPDVVILDLGLPDMDGVEVCTRLREWTQCPIIILSVRDGEHQSGQEAHDRTDERQDGQHVGQQPARRADVELEAGEKGDLLLEGLQPFIEGGGPRDRRFAGAGHDAMNIGWSAPAMNGRLKL